MTKHSITTEQIEALNSEYVTKDVIKIILDEVMKTKVEPHYADIDKSAIENTVRALEIICYSNRSTNCLIYDFRKGSGSGYCHVKDGCPFGQNNTCDLSKAIREARVAIKTLED